VTETEEPAQLELFPEPDLVVDYKCSSRVFVAVKPRQTTVILRDACEGIPPLRFNFSAAEWRSFYPRTIGKSSLNKWEEEYCDFSWIRPSGEPLWSAYDFPAQEPVPAKPKKNIQPGPKPSINARKKW